MKDEFNLSNIKIQRVACLGAPKSSTSKPRLLLVKFGDISMKRTILKQATKLRKSSTRSNVYISPDLTPKEHSQNKLLRDELKMQKTAGEKDIYIKCGKIVSRSAAWCWYTSCSIKLAILWKHTCAKPFESFVYKTYVFYPLNVYMDVQGFYRL